MMEVGLMIGGDVPEVSEENKKRAEEYWMYGASADELGKAWGKPAKVAKLKTCANCEYFNNKARTLKALGAEPGMGACMKFKFMCSQDAACQGWDCPSHMDMPDGDDD
jgi:hypothetical protein